MYGATGLSCMRFGVLERALTEIIKMQMSETVVVVVITLYTSQYL